MIPDFQSLMLPLLKRLADKEEHKFRNLIEKLTQCIIDYGICVSTVNTYELKKVDGDYFGEEWVIGTYKHLKMDRIQDFNKIL